MITDDLTTGYVKDMSHMKEMLFRLTRSENPDLFEV